MNKISVTALLFAGLLANPALAHHPLGGEVPQTMMHGLLSGIGHPIIGFDHLAFVLGIGLLAAFQRSRLALPAGFVGGTVAGTLLIIGGVALPAVELVITLSVLMVGLVATTGRNLKALPAAGLAGLAGVFHGWANGEAVVGAEASPIIAYLAGFGLVQMVIATGVMVLAVMMKDGKSTALMPRFAGAMVAGVGLTYLVEIAETAVFAGI